MAGFTSLYSTLRLLERETAVRSASTQVYDHYPNRIVSNPFGGLQTATSTMTGPLNFSFGASTLNFALSKEAFAPNGGARFATRRP